MATSFSGSDSIDVTSFVDLENLSEDVKKYIKNLQMDLDDTKSSEAMLKKQVQAKNNAILNLQSNQELQKKRYSRLEQKTANLQKELQRANEELKSRRAPSTIQFDGPSFDEIDNLKRENDLLRGMEREKSELIKNLNQQLSAIQSVLQSKVTEASKLGQELMKVQNKSQLAGPSSSKEYAQVLEEKSRLVQKINELQGKLKAVNAKLNEYSKLNTELKNKCARLEQTAGKNGGSRDNFDAINLSSKSLSSIQKRKEEIDDDQGQLVFPSSHQEIVQTLMNYFQSIGGKKQKCKFLNILGAIAENKIDQISTATVFEELND